MSNLAIDGLRDLSDEDVRLLYDIVTAAEASRSPPFRALFTAYEKELSKRGISRDHDQVYLRFLLRMGENRKEGHGLYDQFEVLLSKLGFQVAFDEDDKEKEEAEEHTTDYDLSPSPPRIDLLQTQSFKPARRLSFDSAFDTNTNTNSKSLAALPVRRRSIEGLSELSTEHKPLNIEYRRHNANVSLGQDHKLKDLARNSHDVLQSVLKRKADDEPHESDETLAEGSEVSDEVRQPLPPEAVVRHEPDIQKVSPFDHFENKKRQLEANSKTLKYHHVAARAVLLFRGWTNSAKDAHNDHERMADIALHHDAIILAQQAFDQWRLVLREKRRKRETEKFFESLQTRAGGARDLFLLTKSFTHWAQCASEETLRRTKARKLILQTRYFNAWRDITVVNELKARHLCLSKFLNLWIKRTEKIFDDQDQAVEFNQSRSLQHAYRQWFWTFCERRTPAWYISKRKDSIFKKWLGLGRESLIRKAWALEFRNLELVRSCATNWTRRSGIVVQNQHEAENFRRRALLGPTVENLRKELELAPVQSHVLQISAWRVARAAFATWNQKSRDIREAGMTNDLRMMRNAWTMWNDSMRCQALSRTVDDRILTEFLYKWVLADRLVIFQKAKEDDLQKNVLKVWLTKTNALTARLEHAQDLSWLSQKNRRMSSMTAAWVARSQAERQEKSRAESLHSTRLVLRSMKAWFSGNDQCKRLKKSSEDARFYSLASRTIKIWRKLTLVSKRNKRRDAFSAFRQKTKIKISSKMLKKWNGLAHLKARLPVRAVEMQQKRSLSIGAHIFDDWRQHLSVLHVHEQQAYALWSGHNLKHRMQILISCVHLVQEAETRANEFAQSMIELEAASSLRKINWKAFQLKRQQESSFSLLQRNRKKHHRHMLRYWASLTIQRQQLRGSIIDPEQQVSTQKIVEIHDSPFTGRALRHKESQSTGPKASNGPVTATPGYLRTPSRRVTLGKARLQGAARTQPHANGDIQSQSHVPVTPSTARITPFMNRIRAQYPTSNDLAFSSSTVQRGSLIPFDNSNSRNIGDRVDDISENLLDFGSSTGG